MITIDEEMKEPGWYVSVFVVDGKRYQVQEVSLLVNGKPAVSSQNQNASRVLDKAEALALEAGGEVTPFNLAEIDGEVYDMLLEMVSPS